MRNPHAGQPFTTSDEELADALMDVSLPTLLLSLVHMSGDPTLIRGALKPAGLFLNEVQGCAPWCATTSTWCAHRSPESSQTPW